MKKKNVLWGCIALVAVLAVVICLVLFWGNKDDEGTESSSAAASTEASASESESGTAAQDESIAETVLAMSCSLQYWPNA